MCTNIQAALYRNSVHKRGSASQFCRQRYSSTIIITHTRRQLQWLFKVYQAYNNNKNCLFLLVDSTPVILYGVGYKRQGDETSPETKIFNVIMKSLNHCRVEIRRKIKFCYRLQYECRVSIRQNDGKNILSLKFDTLMIHAMNTIELFLKILKMSFLFCCSAYRTHSF